MKISQLLNTLSYKKCFVRCVGTNKYVIDHEIIHWYRSFNWSLSFRGKQFLIWNYYWTYEQTWFLQNYLTMYSKDLVYIYYSIFNDNTPLGCSVTCCKFCILYTRITLNDINRTNFALLRFLIALLVCWCYYYKYYKWIWDNIIYNYEYISIDTILMNFMLGTCFEILR